MNKWKSSAGAKFAAWVGITISGVLFLASVVGAMAIWEGGLYEYTSEEACREELYKSVANQYAVRALDNMDVQIENKWNETNFRYGIIKAEDIDRLDFNDEKNYIECNFTEDVREDELYKMSYEIGEDTYFSYSGTLFGASFVGSRSGSYTETEPVYQVLYDVEQGIFYYETGSEFFPVREVQIGCLREDELEVYTFSYDFKRKMYQNLGISNSEVTDVTYIYEYSSLDEVLQQEYITLNMLSDVGYPFDAWVNVTLDGRQYANDGSDIWWVDSNYFEVKPVKPATANVNYEIVGPDEVYADPVDESADAGSEEYAIEAASNESKATILKVPYETWVRITYDEDPTNETYWVVVQLPEEVALDWSGDLFEQANVLVTVGYGMRYSIYVILFVSLAFTIAFFVFLMSAAGRRRDADVIVASWLDKIPFDVYVGFWVIFEYALAMVAVNICHYVDQVPGMIIFAFSIICMCWLLLLAFLTFAVRAKLGKWWHNTVIWMMGHVIVGVLKTIFTNIPVLWKAMLAIGVLSVAEFLVMASGDASGGIIIFWFVEKMILALLLLLAIVQMQKLKVAAERMAEGNLEHSIDTDKMFWEFRWHGENLNSISSGMSRAVDERMKSERFKTELITNVSHDIKTPLTSIINYVDLLEKEDLQNEKAVEYLEVLDRQSARLKKLIEDLIEASKASTGNLAVHLERLEAGVSLVQIVGEFEEKMRAASLELLIAKPEEPIYIQADGRHFWRVIDNLMNNTCKYAQSGTRVYINLEEKDGETTLTFRNTSKYPLNISSDELMERFVRGDSSRNTEGNGLGLSIASSLMELMGGSFELYVDGDLFKVVLRFPTDFSQEVCQI